MRRKIQIIGKLEGKVPLIAGRASGLGKQHAILFAHEGVKALAVRNVQKEKSMEKKRLCEEKGGLKFRHFDARFLPHDELCFPYMKEKPGAGTSITNTEFNITLRVHRRMQLMPPLRIEEKMTKLKRSVALLQIVFILWVQFCGDK